MVNDQVKIINLIARASSHRKVEELLNVFIDDASFSEAAEMKAALSEQLIWENAPQVRSNYRKALEFLD